MPIAEENAGMAHVTAGSSRCGIRGYDHSNYPDILVNVVCLDLTGKPVDSPFVVLYYRESVKAPAGSALTYGPTNSRGRGLHPARGLELDSTGGPNTVTRTGTGVYQATLGGLAGERTAEPLSLGPMVLARSTAIPGCGMPPAQTWLWMSIALTRPANRPTLGSSSAFSRIPPKAPIRCPSRTPALCLGE